MYGLFFLFFSGNIAVIQLTGDTLSVEYQKRGRERDAAAMDEGESCVEGEQLVRCDINVMGLHLQVRRVELPEGASNYYPVNIPHIGHVMTYCR